ncbi:class I SAM-dependent methyltransferase [Alcaligenes faecalis]|uniref:class I SAM-dependent methyltransferase n=1 Tax=Alcaligenes faecalis TaxID=511 RepID=UPI00208E37B3|nr:class I SAM-dependent methyltransferase [Alcaligenes faecalis]USP48370.1 class I SAM-dependent methyltransferase [Alcaligenes faecalis]
MNDRGQASAWLQAWAHLIPSPGTVLDVACGRGRNARWLAERGNTVIGVDRDPEAVAATSPYGEIIQADIENGPWPFAGRQFNALVVTKYLWRPLMPTLLESLEPGGVLVYETFGVGNEQYNTPRNPDFLLQPGELLRWCADFDIVAYEHGFRADPDHIVQRIVAVRPREGGSFSDYRLNPQGGGGSICE